jgi:hypothetical protein
LETTILELSDQREHLFHLGRATLKLANGFVSSALQEKVLKNKYFVRMLDGELGTHSVTKYSTIHAWTGMVLPRTM